MWMFLVERIGTGDPEPGLTYPRVSLSMGKAPAESSRAGLLEQDLTEESNGEYTEHDPYGDDDDDEHYGGSIDDLGEEYQ